MMACKGRGRDEEAQRLTDAEDFEYREAEEVGEDHEALPSSTRAQYLGQAGEGSATT